MDAISFQVTNLRKELLEIVVGDAIIQVRDVKLSSGLNRRSSTSPSTSLTCEHIVLPKRIWRLRHRSRVRRGAIGGAVLEAPSWTRTGSTSASSAAAAGGRLVHLDKIVE
uniref:Uncharacterized protein n=1 Tax=Opuntia streptacantha TaxID=393608 RepID=A0A7C8YB31_OPUST